MNGSMRIRRIFATGLLAGLGCVLLFYGPMAAAPPAARQPFANSVEQRAEMIALLKEIRDELKQQNTLLNSGQLKVTVAEEKQR